MKKFLPKVVKTVNKADGGVALPVNTEVNNRVLSNKPIQEFFSGSLGENSLRIIKLANAEMTDDELAAKAKLKVSEIRAVLNKLHNWRLARYTRIRDKETGWYSYIWHIDLSNTFGVYEKMLQDGINEQERALEESTTVFSFYCPKCSRENRIDMETATNLSFKCPHCKKQLKEFKGSSQTIIEKLDELKKKYSSFKNSLEAGKK